MAHIESCLFLLLICVCPAMSVAVERPEKKVTLWGEVVDATTGAPLPVRVYVRSSDSRWFFVKSASPEGSAVEYSKSRASSVEIHTTVSAHPWVAELPLGRYTVQVERGKEYLPAERTVELSGETTQLKVHLPRWIDMAAAGWYSGDTHVHRPVEELRNLLLAEDLNVALPLSYWVTNAYAPPREDKASGQGPVQAKVIEVDPTHVIYPMNTEYELFDAGRRGHTLGAVFVLGHNTPLSAGVPPVAPIAAEARRQGALLDLDKHSWPWSLMLVPVMKVDLFELANNHVWQTEFGFPQFSLGTEPGYMNLEKDARGFTEWGWIDFGFQTYYALLNCGFRMRATAGTASGVHPVPLGFGRVYVQLPDGFSYDRWMRGLEMGRSFVTTGPMLMVQVDGQPPGAAILVHGSGKRSCRVTGVATSRHPLRPLEIIVNGRVAQRVGAANRKTKVGAYESPFDAQVKLEGSGWISVRVFEDRADGRVRFAHTSPVYIDVPGSPLRPRREEIDYLVRRMKEELERNKDVLRPNDLQEYRQALAVYEEIAARAR